MRKKLLFFSMIIIILIFSLMTFTACNPDETDTTGGDDTGNTGNNEGRLLDPDELATIPTYIFPAETDISLVGYEDEICKFFAAFFVAYTPADIYEEEYEHTYGYLIEDVEEMFSVILPAVNKAGLTQTEVDGLVEIMDRAGDWMKTTKGGTIPEGFGYREYYNLFFNADSLENLLGFASEIIDLIPSEKVGALVYHFIHRDFVRDGAYTHAQLLADAQQRGFGDVVALFEAQGDLDDGGETDIFSNTNDFMFAAAVVWDVASALTDFDAAKLAQAIEFTIKISELEDPTTLLDGTGEYSYKEIVDHLNIVGELVLALEAGGHKYWPALGFRAVEILINYISEVTGEALSDDLVGAYDIIAQNSPFALVKLAGIILRDLKVADVTALFADYDDLDKAEVSEMDAKSAVLAARVSGLLAAAYEKLTLTDKVRLDSLAGAMDDLIKASLQNIPDGYPLPDLGEIWAKAQRYATFGDPDSLSAAQTEEISLYFNALIALINDEVPQRYAVVTYGSQMIDIDAGTSLADYAAMINDDGGLGVYLTDYSLNMDDSYTTYSYWGDMEISASAISGWSSAQGKHTITFTINNNNLTDVQGDTGYPSRTFEATLEINVSAPTSRCTGYYVYEPNIFMIGQEISEYDVSATFYFGNDTVSSWNAEEIRFFGFDSSVAGTGKLAYAIVDFEDYASVAFPIVYDVVEIVDLISGQGYQLENGAVYRFVPEMSGLYDVSSSGSADTYVEIWDAEFEGLISDDDSGEAYNFSLSYFFAAEETYYIFVSSYGNSEGFSFLVEESEVEQIVANQPYAYSGDPGYGLFVPDASGDYTIFSTGTSDSFVRLFDADFNLLGFSHDEEDSNFSLTYYFNAGETYYYYLDAYDDEAVYTFTIIAEEAE